MGESGMDLSKHTCGGILVKGSWLPILAVLAVGAALGYAAANPD